MVSIRPGPSSTDSGLPVLETGSPTETPAVLFVSGGCVNDICLHTSFLVYLNSGSIAFNPNDLPDKLFTPHLANLVHAGTFDFGDNDRPYLRFSWTSFSGGGGGSACGPDTEKTVPVRKPSTAPLNFTAGIVSEINLASCCYRYRENQLRENSR